MASATMRFMTIGTSSPSRRLPVRVDLNQLRRPPSYGIVVAPASTSGMESAAHEGRVEIGGRAQQVSKGPGHLCEELSLAHSIEVRPP